MTTIDTAAACRVLNPVTRVSFAVALAFTLAGCETGSLSLDPNAAAPSAQIAGAPAATAAIAAKGKVAVAPIIGPPDAVTKPLQSQLAASMEKQSIGVTKSPAEKSDYTLRGYIVSAREKANTKVSYIWDVTDPAGKRVNRITGEELIPGNSEKDPWAAVSPQVIQSIADKTAGSISAWLPTQAAVAGASSSGPIQVANAGASVPIPGQTGSIERGGPVTAIVPAVSGAPGDGSTALRAALQKELSRGGVSLTETASAETYSVQGQVKLGSGADGKQPIQIDWHVMDPQGKKLGTVSQKNEIPQGSLDGPWGKTADAAAGAAAQGILKLLPQPKSIN